MSTGGPYRLLTQHYLSVGSAPQSAVPRTANSALASPRIGGLAAQRR